MKRYSNLLWIRTNRFNRFNGFNGFTNFSFKQQIKQKFENIFDFYEDFIGVKEVRKTQEAVLKSESTFVESTKARRNVQNDVSGLQQQLKQIRHKLDSTKRSDESFLSLVTKEHQLLNDENRLDETLRRLEEEERHHFSEFSQRLRDAHEVERLRQEKTKYISLIGSIVGACLGIIATSISYAFKRKDFERIVKLIEKNDLTLSAAKPLELIEEKPIFAANKSTETQTDVKSEDKIVEIISNTESNLEYKMKVNSLTTVVATYALIAITLPIIMKIISD